MARECTVCVHPERETIDERLVCGAVQRDIAREFRLDPTSVHRHRKNHIPQFLTLARHAKEVAQADGLLEQVEKLRDRAIGILDKAEDANENKTALSAIREARGCIELLGKLLGELQDGQAVNVLVTTEWTQIRASVMGALAAHPEARAEVGRALREVENAS